MAAFGQTEELDFRGSAREYANALDNVEIIAKTMEAKLVEVEQIDQSISAATQQVKSLREQAETLRQEANDIQNAAQNAATAGASQSPGGGAGGGSGGGAGGGGKGGGMEGKEPPKLGEAPKFEMPPAVAEASSLGDVIGKLGFNPGRGIGAGSPTEFTGSTFDPNAFRLNTGTRPMSSFTPGDVASGNLPQLQGGSSVGSPIADANAAQAAAASPAGPGAGGAGMMGGAMGGGIGAGGGAAAGDDSLASVGREEEEGPSPKINSETMATGSGGEGGESGSSVSTTGDADESPVARQKSAGGDTIVVASERGVQNPEARGLMTYVGTGFLRELCGNKSAAVGVCLGPLPAGAKPAVTVTESDSEIEAGATTAERGIASVPDVTPAQASVGPQRSERRAGILGLLSGK